MKKNKYPFYQLDGIIDQLMDLPDMEDLNEKDAEALQVTFSNEVKQVYRRLRSDMFLPSHAESGDTVMKAYLESIEHLVTDTRKLQAGATQRIRLSGLSRSIFEGLMYLRRAVADRSSQGNAKLNGNAEKGMVKLLCHLSVDQIALLLKAADDIRLVSARSFSSLLQAVVPYLSTDRMESFSWKSTRSSTYKMESSDIEVALSVLDRLKEKIESYR